MLKLLKSACTFCNKIFDPVNNYVHDGEKYLHQEVGNRYVCLSV